MQGLKLIRASNKVSISSEGWIQLKQWQQNEKLDFNYLFDICLFQYAHHYCNIS